MANESPARVSTQAYQEYMARVQREQIPCYEPIIGEPELRAVTDVITRNWLSEDKYTRVFEERLRTVCQRQYAVATCNATAALIAGMRALGLKSGDEVIVPSLSHPADPNSIVAAGATPVFADVEAATLCLSVESIEAVRTPRTKAILLVSAYGNAADLSELEAYASEHKLWLINDCAAALGSTYKGRPVAAYGVLAVLSFFADKTITTGEGGMLLTDTAELVADVNFYKHDGRRERGHDLIERTGYNFRITELQTAVGVAQLDRLSYFIQRKKEIWQQYRDALANVSAVTIFAFNPDSDAVPHRIVIMVPAAAALIEYLEARGIGVRTLFMPMHRQPAYQAPGSFPVTERLYARGICLPSAPTLSADDIAFISQTIAEFYHA
jgi:perosamine synthetase